MVGLLVVFQSYLLPSQLLLLDSHTSQCVCGVKVHQKSLLNVHVHVHVQVHQHPHGNIHTRTCIYMNIPGAEITQ